MEEAIPIDELDVFQSDKRLRDKPTIPLTNVIILSRNRIPEPVDLFDALFKGPFQASGTYNQTRGAKLKCQHPTPVTVRVPKFDGFSIEEDDTVSPPVVKIFFEGEMAWYRIVSVHPQYRTIFRTMELKARLWLWIQLQRSEVLCASATRRTPSLKGLMIKLPEYFTMEVKDPFDTYHPYLIERILQSHFMKEQLAVGPANIMPKWMDTILVDNFRTKYPAVFASISDKVQATLNPSSSKPASEDEEDLQEPLSPISKRNLVQKPSAESRKLIDLLMSHVKEVRSGDLVALTRVISSWLPESDKWRDLLPVQIQAKFCDHAEAILSNDEFVLTFGGWIGIDQIRRFASDKKWWKLVRISKQRDAGEQESSKQESSDEQSPSTSLGNGHSHQTPADAGQKRFSSKTTSTLRPTAMATSTPMTPTKSSSGSDDKDIIIDSDGEEPKAPLVSTNSAAASDKESRLLKAMLRKRKAEEIKENGVKKPRPNRSKQDTTLPDRANGFFSRGPTMPDIANELVLFGQGCPPVKTVKIGPFTTMIGTTYHCPFPDCRYTRSCATTKESKEDIDKHHHKHLTEITDALTMLKDPWITGGRVGGEKGNRLIRPIGEVDHLLERIESMAKDLGTTPSKRLAA